jgi:hypothetical protein
MDNVQKHNTCNNIPSSQTFKSYESSSCSVVMETTGCANEICWTQNMFNYSVRYLFQIVFALRNISDLSVGTIVISI